MKTDWTTYTKNLIKTQFTIHMFLLCILTLIASFFVMKEFFTYVTFILLFNTFDVIGYGNMINVRQDWENDGIIKPYRIMQTLFQIVTLIVVYYYAGTICLIACILGWWMGGCDLLYYIVLKEKFQEYDYWWMKGWSVWLVLTPVKKLIFKTEYIGRVEFIIICSIGLIAGGVISCIF
jgi:hypothetical protein